MVRNERRRSMSQSDASFFIARSSVDLGSLGKRICEGYFGCDYSSVRWGSLDFNKGVPHSLLHFFTSSLLPSLPPRLLLASSSWLWAPMDSIYIASAGCSGARLDPNTCRKECQYRCQIKCQRECQLEWSRMSDRTSEYDRICSMPYALPDSCYVRNYVRIIRLGITITRGKDKSGHFHFA